jgi:hypothetical protein
MLPTSKREALARWRVSALSREVERVTGLAKLHGGDGKLNLTNYGTDDPQSISVRSLDSLTRRMLLVVEDFQLLNPPWQTQPHMVALKRLAEDPLRLQQISGNLTKEYYWKRGKRLLSHQYTDTDGRVASLKRYVAAANALGRLAAPATQASWQAMSAEPPKLQVWERTWDYYGEWWDE